jgi:hypothetical protein
MDISGAYGSEGVDDAEKEGLKCWSSTVGSSTIAGLNCREAQMSGAQLSGGSHVGGSTVGRLTCRGSTVAGSTVGVPPSLIVRVSSYLSVYQKHFEMN